MIDHPAVEAVRRMKGHLHRLMSPSGLPGPPSHRHRETDLAAAVRLAPSFNREQVERMLRVEYSRDHAPVIWEALRGDYGLADQIRGMGGHNGPMTIEGVAWYCVPYLPEPGWRVINPMSGRSA